MNIPNILIPVLTGVICAILGYLLGKSNSKKDNSLEASIQADLDACKTNAKSLHNKMVALEAEIAANAKIVSSASQQFASPEPELVFDSELAKSVFGKKIKENDLKIVEGIGPKIEALFNAAGITTWRALSEASKDRLRAVLDAAGENYAIHNPSTWSKQALLAYQGKWQELKDLQNGLLSGKE